MHASKLKIWYAKKNRTVNNNISEELINISNIKQVFYSNGQRVRVTSLYTLHACYWMFHKKMNVLTKKRKSKLRSVALYFLMPVLSAPFCINNHTHLSFAQDRPYLIAS